MNAPRESLPYRVAADLPITRVDLLNLWQRSRLIGVDILNRHRLLGTFEKLKEGASSVLFALANFHGVAMRDREGLMIDADRDVIAASIGFKTRSINQPILQLEDLQVIRITGCRSPTLLSC
jgi:hypothetical protein